MPLILSGHALRRSRRFPATMLALPSGSLKNTRTPLALAVMDTGLAGKGVIVTGASGGIGGACARLFAAEGANVLVHYHQGRERAFALADEIGARTAQVDLTSEADVDRLFTGAR